MPEEVIIEADRIFDWALQRGQVWRTERKARRRAEREAEAQRRAAEEAAAAKRAAEVAEAERERLKRRVAVETLLDDTSSDEDEGARGLGGSMDVDQNTVADLLRGKTSASSGVAAAASTGGTIEDDEGENERGGSSSPAESVQASAVRGRAVVVDVKRPAAERVTFRSDIHEVSHELLSWRAFLIRLKMRMPRCLYCAKRAYPCFSRKGGRACAQCGVAKERCEFPAKSGTAKARGGWGFVCEPGIANLEIQLRWRRWPVPGAHHVSIASAAWSACQILLLAPARPRKRSVW